jgi:methylglyoxal synthase
LGFNYYFSVVDSWHLLLIFIPVFFYNQSKHMKEKKNIALIAHDNKKKDLVEWLLYNKEEMSRHQLFATGTTGKIAEEALKMPVTKLLSGPLGGDQQIGAMISEKKIDVLIFFWDPMQAQPHDPDVKALIRLGVVWNIPVACNRATADFIISSPLMKEKYEGTRPDYSDYLGRVL